MVSKSNIVLVLGLVALSFALGEHASAGAGHKPTAVERVYQMSAQASTNPQSTLQGVIDTEEKDGFRLSTVIPMTQITKLSAVAPSAAQPVYELVFVRA